MSNETKFTPGPWVMQHGKDVHGNAEWMVRVYPDGIGITTLTRLPRPGIEQEFNAHLLAAAPELYEALEGLMDDLSLRAKMRGEVVENAFDALAKARGEA